MTILTCATDERACFWCGTAFAPRTSGGSPQRFCRPSCRRAFGDAARRWATVAVERGLITVATLKAAPTSARAVCDTVQGNEAG